MPCSPYSNHLFDYWILNNPSNVLDSTLVIVFSIFYGTNLFLMLTLIHVLTLSPKKAHTPHSMSSSCYVPDIYIYHSPPINLLLGSINFLSVYSFRWYLYSSKKNIYMEFLNNANLLSFDWAELMTYVLGIPSHIEGKECAIHLNIENIYAIDY